MDEDDEEEETCRGPCTHVPRTAARPRGVANAVLRSLRVPAFHGVAPCLSALSFAELLVLVLLLLAVQALVARPARLVGRCVLVSGASKCQQMPANASLPSLFSIAAAAA